MRPIQIAISPCPNDIFIFGALILKKVSWDDFDFHFNFEDIQTLNQIGIKKDVDLLKFSFALYPMIKNRYQLLNVGSALGRGVGPLLIGKGDLAPEKREKVLIPGFHTTAALLCREYGPTNVSYEETPYHQIMPALAKNDRIAGVIIHESRFTYQKVGLNLLTDLGSAWESDRRLPLPLGGIAIKRGYSNDLQEEIERKILLSLDYARANPEDLTLLLKEHAQEMEDKVIHEHIELYVNEFSRDLGEEGQLAIKALCEISDQNGIDR